MIATLTNKVRLEKKAALKTDIRMMRVDISFLPDTMAQESK